ncbi:MAG: ATP synthase F0 subunit B [Myxococcales bacterium]|nr:ATP synthase F0 subunit B [Myxococcales bacterium]
MKRFSSWLPPLFALLALTLTSLAWAEKSAPGAGHGATAPHGADSAEGAAPSDPGGEHGADHGPGPINWYYGMIAESADAEPSVLFRPKGMQPPLLAMLLNAGILFFVVIRVARRPVADALKKRKASIMHGMDDAARMKSDASDRLAEYEDKLEHLDEEIERVKREMREAGQAERARILAEAKERRARMERDARLLIEQELAAARQALVREAVEGAVKSATERISKEIAAADHQRVADEYLAELDQAFVTRGGKA